MLFGIIPRKSSTLLDKLDSDLSEMLRTFSTLGRVYREKLEFLRKTKEEQDREETTTRDAETILKKVDKFLKLIKLEKSHYKTEERHSSKALDILKELLERWRANRKLVRLTYQEYSDLNILYESLRNLISILHRQRVWLKKHMSDPPSFIENFPDFGELVKQEGILIGKEKEFLKVVQRETQQIEETSQREFTYSLVGYGSLMNKYEVKKLLISILKEAETEVSNINTEFKARVTPVWVVGYKRIFNKIATRGVWETKWDVKANRVAVLNIVASVNSKFNAVALKLTDDEYRAVQEREKNYGIIELKHVYDYRTGQRLTQKCICVKSDPLKIKVRGKKSTTRVKFYAKRLRKYAYGMDPSRLIKSNKMPVPDYIIAIDGGVRELDSVLGTVGMYDNYLNTTYCYYIDRSERDGKKRRDYGEIKLIDYYKLIGKEIERRQLLGII